MRTGGAASAAGHPLEHGRPPLRALLAAALLCAGLAVGAYEALPAGNSPAPGRHRAAVVQAGLLSLPVAAQGVASEAIGARNPAYRVHAVAGGGFSVASSTHGLQGAFDATGVSVTAGGAHVHLRLLGAGFGHTLQPVRPAPPHAEGNRVAYSHRGGLGEWYVNGPLGLEQGFTVARPPGTRRAGALTLAIGLSGNVAASLTRNGRTVEFTHGGRRVMRYTGLSASGAGGHALHTWLSLDGRRILLHLETRGARFPVRVDPLVQEEKLLAEGEEGEGHLGATVALSSDGNTALVGAPRDNAFQGAAFVFTRTGSVWSQQGPPLKGSEGLVNPFFGSAVALSADGNTALIGGSGDNNGKGAAWVFTRTGSTWTQQGPKLTASEETAPQPGFGVAVALSAEGSLALVGGPNETVGTTIVDGAVWAFTRSAGKWSQQGAKITAKGECCTGAEGGQFGWSIALSAAGTTAIIGAPIEEEEGKGGGERGAVYAFTRSGETWSQQGSKITPTGEIGEGQFGLSVALSAEGNTALVGAPWDNNAKGFGPGTGAAWVFTRSGKKWSQQGEKLTGEGESGREAQFGHSVALSFEGNLALIGGPWDTQGEENLPGHGAAWVFTQAGGKWSQQGEKLTARGETGNGEFAESVALASNGRTAVLGGALDKGSLGGAWAFVSGATISEQAAREVTQKEAVLHASVNPNGEEVTSCVFEYGTTTAYGSTAECSPAKPGSGEAPVAVSSPVLSKLGINTTYHFRVAARNAFGTSYGTDTTFTTLATFASAETSEPATPAKATDGSLSVEGSGGTGKVTIGPYGKDLGGLPLARSTGAYFQIYRSTTATFTQIVYKDCDLGGAKAIWWDDPATGWEPISEPVAVYSESPTPCVTVTATEKTKPSIAQLSDPRHVGGPAGGQEYGKCLPFKKGRFSDSACGAPDEKNGKPKGSFEWFAAPADCFPLKHGRYEDDACQTLDVKKEKPKGKYELGSNAFTAVAGATRFEGGAAGTLECEASSAEGQLQSVQAGSEATTYTGCKQASTKCASAGAPAGTIQAEPVETVAYSEDGKYYTGLAGYPIMKYTCGSTQYKLLGEVSGEASGDLGTMSTHSEAVFKPSVGFQSGLTMEVSNTETLYPTTLTTTVVTTSTDPNGFEISKTVKQPTG
ncbi:MAG TPA: hypothetical protein VMB91_13960 [Solirubrobacteraceae bacterium]|nr:hypothetical protein [Solirubrobacteraceae bacterium]